MNITMCGNGSVVINGKSFTGGNICINGDTVVVDGKAQDGLLTGKITVEVHGDVSVLQTNGGDVKAVNIGNVTTGSGYVKAEHVEHIKTGSGDVTCGDVIGGIETGTGDITCGSVGGSVKTSTGDIYHK